MDTGANTIHLTDDRFRELTRAALEHGKTPDELADEAIAMLLRKRALNDLMEFGQRHTRELGIPESDVSRLISEARAESNPHGAIPRSNSRHASPGIAFDIGSLSSVGG